MADENQDLTLEPDAAGLAFRSEMWASDMIFRYWKHMLGAVVVILVVVFGASQYKKARQNAQRAVTHQISEIESELPEDLRSLSVKKIIGSGDQVEAAKLVEVGDKLAGVAKNARGTAAIEARLKAAELFRLANEPAKQRENLEAAAAQASGVLEYAAVAALANLDLEEDKGDDAVRRLRSLLSQPDFLAQQAAINLGLALEHLERPDEAKTVYDEFLQKWPDAALAEQARERRDTVGSTAVGSADGAGDPE